MNVFDVDLPPRFTESITDPYVMFYADGYLPEQLDNELRRTFPDRLVLNRLGERLAVNVDLSENSVEILEFLRANPVWDRYLQSWKSPSALQKLIERFSDQWDLRWYRSWRFFFKQRSRKPTNLEVTVLLSVYRAGFQLAPHSDDKFKLLSLIHYLPHDADTNDPGAGTTFFVPKSHCKRRDLRQFSEWSRGLRRYLPLWLAPTVEASLSRRYFISDEVNLDERSRFSEYFEVIRHVGYRTNRISGFLKNDWSMHEVNLREFPDNALRRAVLINVRLRPKMASHVIPKIESFAMKIKAVRRRHVDS